MVKGFIHFVNILLANYYIIGTVLVTWSTLVNKTKNLCLYGVYTLSRNDIIKYVEREELWGGQVHSCNIRHMSKLFSRPVSRQNVPITAPLMISINIKGMGVV